jgi:hypothetical protein
MDTDTRDCILFSDNPNLINDPFPFTNAPHPLGDARFEIRKASAFPFAGADGATLNTDAEFGCVQWEART